jgi:Lon protease-like protein
MLADCLLTDRRFGITPVIGSSEVPTPGTIGCVAEVRVNQELPDGCSNIVVIGGSRFVLSDLLDEPHPYQVALVQTFDDDTEAELADLDTTELRDLFGRYLAAVSELHDAMPEESVLPEDPSGLSFHIAGGIECDLGVKRRLLAERSTVRRIQALSLLLPVLTSTIESGLKVHQRSHTNGKGGALPDLLAQ